MTAGESGRSEEILPNLLETQGTRMLLATVCAVFLVVLVRTAWICDDAYITFRVVENFVQGYGLRWNIAERVQPYTHPFWMFLVAAGRLITGEVFYSSILLSIAVSLAAVLVLAFGIARSELLGVLGVAVLTFSKAFMDYSTSGLENPMTHLLLAVFLVVYLKSSLTVRSLLVLSFVAALAAFNRMDTILFFLPPLCHAFWRLRSRRALGMVLMGFTPFVLWELSSLFYYGFLFPNTAYAKLSTGIAAGALVRQGMYYLLNSINLDPITLLVTALAIGMALWTRKTRHVAVAVGILLYLAYVIRIGGDFMSGRYFTGGLFCAVAILVDAVADLPRSAFLAGAVLVPAVGLMSPASPVLAHAKYGTDREKLADRSGIVDERGWYYQATGLLKASRVPLYYVHRWAREGVELRRGGPPVTTAASVGLYGFYAGPQVHLVDEYGLADPLLARLPAKRDPKWRIGHFRRAIPEGYLETLRTGVNRIADKNLATFYEKLRLITRGPLLSRARFLEIWKMNLGRYKDLIDADAYKYPGMIRVGLSAAMSPKKAGGYVLTNSGIQIDLGRPRHEKQLEISVDANDDYEIVYLRGKTQLARSRIIGRIDEKGLAVRVLPIPPAAAAKGYDKIRIFPLWGDETYSVGHVRLLAEGADRPIQ